MQVPALTRLGLIALPLAAAAAALVLIALPALNGPLVLDSVKLHSLGELVTRHGDAALARTPGFGGGYDRIVSMASFVLNIQLAGELSAFQLKLTNILIHVTASLLVFALTHVIMRATPHADIATPVALGAGLLWLMSPLNLNVALYTVQRMTQLAALFTLAGLTLYTAGRLHPRRGAGRLMIALGALVCLPLAVLSKQNGILLIAFAFLVEVYVLRSVSPRLSGRQLAVVGVVGAAAALGAAVYVYPQILSYGQRDFTLAERLMSQPRALLDYLGHIVLPRGADAGIHTDDFTKSTSLLAPPWTIAALIACLAALAFCLVRRRGRAGLVAFGLAFFLVGHAVESTFIPLELYFLHRNYLPSYGIYFALAFLGATLLPDRRWLALLLGLYVAYFAAIDYARALTWSSRANLASAAIQHHPDSPRAMADYAQVALAQGNFRQAAAANGRAIQLTGALNSRIQRLYILCRAGASIPGKEYQALQDIRTFGVSNELAQALGNLLQLYRTGGCGQLDAGALVDVLDELAARYEAEGGNPWTIAYYADTFLYVSGQEPRAHQRLEQRLANGHLESGLYRLELLIDEGRTEAASRVLEQIREGFDSARLARYAETLEALRQRIDAL